MKILMLIYLTVSQLVKQALLLPQTIMLALKQKRRQTEMNEDQVERLDRLRNPSKYQGK